MTDSGTITIHCDWLSDEAFFIRGVTGQRATVDAITLKTSLFAWHEPSYYGTFIESAEQNQVEGIVLSATQALDYFSHLPHLHHANFVFSTEVSQLIQLSPSIKQALSAGNFMPDFYHWKKGSIGWKLQLADSESTELAETPLSQAWIDALISERIRTDPETKQNIEQLKLSYPLLNEGSVPTEHWLDEEDWLVSIGWNVDATPFRTCLRLIEPLADEGWQLTILLQDRYEQSKSVIWTSEQAIEIPSEWHEHIGRVHRDIQRWLQLVPWLRDEQHDDQIRTVLSYDEAWRFLTDSSLILMGVGYSVLLPAWWERLKKVRPRLRAKIRSSTGVTQQSSFGLQQIMEFDWKLAVGDLEITEKEYRELLEQKRHLVQFQGQWIQLDPKLIEQIGRVATRLQKKGLSFRDVLELHLLGGDPISDSRMDDSGLTDSLRMEVELNDHLRGMIDQLTHTTAIPDVSVPASFTGTLRPYQKDGLSWMLFLRKFGLGGCLADDMGLGKTIQWITYLLSVKEIEKPTSPSLLICPTSVLGNWQKELRRFAPNMSVYLHYGPQRLKGDSFRNVVQDYDLVLTSYTLSSLDESDIGSVGWDSICLDEAQNIKNTYTKQATAIRGFQGYHRVAMTGTPIENRLSELWSIFDFINPGYLGNLREFNAHFALAIENEKDPEAIAKVQRLIQPFLLRREKKDPAIQLDLPEKNEGKVYFSLTPEQGSLYENYIQNMFDKIDKLSAMERRGMILASLTKLKQLCNHPAFLLNEPVSLQTPDRSNKVHRLLEMVEELRDENGRCLIFTQFVETGHMLQRLLQQRLDEKVQFLHGGTPRQTRENMIDLFQNQDLSSEESCGVFILSLRAGGTGLNLTAANHVFHFDRWWNPAVENQATDRAFRIGQKRHVQVHKFITLGTLEEKIDEMIERKMGMSEQIVGGGEHWITELSTDDLRELLMLRNEWL